MASTTSKPAKQLGELLQEQQEPFTLDAYLIERGYVKKNINSKTEGKFGFCNVNSSKFLSRSTISGLGKSRKASKIWRGIRKKLVFTNESKSFNKSTCDVKVAEFSVNEMPRNSQEVAESDRFSSASSTTVYNSFTDSDDKDEAPPTSLHKHHASLTPETLRALKLYNMKEKMAAADRKFLRRFTEDNKQHSPVSVLDSISESSPYNGQLVEGEESRTRRRMTMPSKVTEDSILSATMWELLFHSASEKQRCSEVSELMEAVRSNPSLQTQLLKSKRMLQQTRQLLFDCVRELVETHARKVGEKQQHYHKQFLGPEELGKLLSEKMKGWSKQAGDETNITNLLDLEFSDSIQQWSNFGPAKTEIGLEIGDKILQEIIDQIVSEANDFRAPMRC
ncbi:hypothetical protein FNV43_RR12656 [Rhamnella rubrinervis]|uniref:DUF4378 domain-containing protein n=1 Tax=Rhamnella rubrinervis TaxID=2594499 RepID=A0A8K0MJ32_9ROSA|nr:hypothetical protein FNV43_RR12656 [Rhamnella rubrinervis]